MTQSVFLPQVFLKSVHLVMQGFCSVCLWSEKEREANKIKDQLSKHSQTALNKSHSKILTFHYLTMSPGQCFGMSVMLVICYSLLSALVIDVSLITQYFFLYLIPRQGQNTLKFSMVHLMPAGRCCTTIWTQKTSFSIDRHSKVGVF